MNEVYFDSNVYGHIYRLQHGITKTCVKKLEQAVESDRVRIFASIPVLEETTTAILNNIQEALGRLRLIRNLAKRKKLIKPPALILEGDVVAYAEGTKSPSKFEAPRPGLRRLFFDRSSENIKTWREVALETKEEILKYSDEMNMLFNKIRPLTEERKKKKTAEPLIVYWEAIAERWAEHMAEDFNVLDKCRAKGIAGLLNVRSIRAHMVVQVSLAYANAYERKTFDGGNSRDIHHVVCASAVPTFVTHDKALARVLTRMPIPDFEVIELKTLLNRI